MDLNWSPKPSKTRGDISMDVLKPVWSVEFPVTAGYDQLARHACVAVPMFLQATTSSSSVQQPVNEMEAFRQIQLVCYFDFVRSAGVRASTQAVDPATSFGSYMVRVMGDGGRLPVDLRMHATNFSSSSLLYDRSYNALYLTTFASASYEGPKRIFRMRLTASYNYEGDVSGVVASASIFEDPGFVVTHDAAGSSSTLVHFDGAVIEPATNRLFFYAPASTIPEDSVPFLEMYLLASDPFTLADGTSMQTVTLSSSSVRSTDRRWQPVKLSLAVSPSSGMRRLFAGLTTVYDLDTPPEMFFGLYGTLFVRDAATTTRGHVYREAYRCAACPAGTTTRLPGAQSAEECRCPLDFFYDYASSSCKRVSDSCGAGEFIVVKATATSDIVCAKCPACARGTYRDPTDCQPNQLRPLLAPAKCVACPSCPPGYYINPETCNASSSVAPKGIVGIDCLPCPGCKEGETIAGTICPGTTLWNTQSCQKCTASCPDGTYISRSTERCSGTTRGSPTDPLNPETECVLCEPCTEQGQARVGGCTGKLRDDPPVCAACEVCGVGEYITQECSVSSVAVPREQRCAACPPCKAGEYLARACSGTNLMKPDHVCLPCATCPKDTYVVPCGLVTDMNSTMTNTTTSWLPLLPLPLLPKPADAGRCAPCKTCAEGYYMTQRCEGSIRNPVTTSDVVQCAKCDDKCPRGTYMRAKCPGNTTLPSTNDCQPCVPCGKGEYMASGKCVDGTGATSALQRTCEFCTPCSEGEYMASVCTGTSVFDVSDCAACEACPAGTYLKTPCNGSGLSPTQDRVCEPCKTCPKGFYRKGCGLGGILSSVTVDDVQCLPCTACATGEYVQESCSGSGSDPIERRCAACGSCGIGRYYATGCRGHETSGNFTCAACNRCPVGTYISGGCGSGRGTLPDPTCTKCAPCPDGYYISVPCNGLSFASTSRVCAKCSSTGPCPAGYYTAVECTPQGTSDRVCRSIATNETLEQSSTQTTALAKTTTTTTTTARQAVTTTPAPPTSASQSTTTTTSSTSPPSSTPAPPPPPPNEPDNTVPTILFASLGVVVAGTIVLLLVKLIGGSAMAGA